MNNKHDVLDNGSFFHGTRAELKIGDLLKPQYLSNYQDKKSNYIYFTATLDAAKWGAELGSWERHSAEEINNMLTSLKKLQEEGKNIIYD